MSDVGIAPAPAPSAPPAPAPQAPAAPPRIAHEVVIDQNPANPPAPIGSQAPPSPQARAESRREAIQKSFAKSREGKSFPEAPAKPGHNRPPEPLEPAPAAPPPKEKTPPPAGGIDLRRPPSADTALPPARGEHGHFAPRADRAQRPAQQQAPQGQQLPASDPYRAPLARMSQASKAEWHAAPAHVRAEVHRMHREFSNFHQQARQLHEAFKPLQPYYDLARSQGTTLDRALNNYVSMENKLRADPIGGLDVLVRNMNLRTADGQQITLADIAQYVLSRTPEQHAQLQTQNLTSAHNSHINQLTQQISQLAGVVQHMQARQQYRNQYRQMKRGVDRFAATHPRIDEPGFGDVVVQELKAGHRLDHAYARANLLHPPGRTAPAAQTRAPAAQTRAPDRSISGSPAGAPATFDVRTPRRGGQPPSRRDIIAHAVRRASGSL
jgi:hypothetical protein